MLNFTVFVFIVRLVINNIKKSEKSVKFYVRLNSPIFLLLIFVTNKNPLEF